MMSEPLTSDRVRRFWRELQRLLTERAATESRLTGDRSADAEAFRQTRCSALECVAAWRTGELTAAESDRANEFETIAASFDSRVRDAKNAAARTSEELLERSQTEEEQIEQTRTEARWTLEAVHEANVKKARAVWDHSRRQYAERRQAAANIKQTALERHRAWSLTPAGIDSARSPATVEGDGLARIDEHLDSARTLLRRFERMIAPRILLGDRLLWTSFLLWGVIAASGWFMPKWYYGPLAATALVPVVVLLARWLFAVRARSQTVRIGQPLFRAIAIVDRLGAAGEFTVEDAFKQAVAESARRQRTEIGKSDGDCDRRHQACVDDRERQVTAGDEQRANEQARLTAERAAEVARIESEHAARVEQIESRAQAEQRTAQDEHDRAESAHQSRFESADRELIGNWSSGRARLMQELDEIQDQSSRLFPDWKAIVELPLPGSVPLSLRFGALDVEIAVLEGGQPSDHRLEPFAPPRFALPALLPFPKMASTLVHTGEAARGPAVEALQSLMLRALTALPPGKVRFTIVDPVGLGENFASFMHLADSDELLVSSRIWTEPAQIERRLTDLTAHMENVIQKYLRNQYKSIEEYNAEAGEVAEPYRILVAANFPTNFSAEMCRRLVSIASSGAACGVFVLVSVDPRQAMPQGFDLRDLEAVCINLSWSSGRFAWEDGDFAKLPLTIDSPPPANEVARIVRHVGERAKQAGRVEVDFSFIEPPRERWWSADSRGGIDVPLGRAGATKRQHLHLGVGTAQHALVAGKTGSGKSTLLHALITNLALHYSPDELELYLIDFKKGVEFKTYATHHLPHARVIAIESEREFGLSVLQRLDAELKRRGEWYRTAGVQDVAAFRDKRDGSETALPAHLPRILLIVDEFQEFFVEDDRLSQDAALLLDRLVRQGRAFGLHVLLGSQTLGGAYSLARSTIDQMAVRIALQCSEADANLILAKDNNAARLLSRPGEAIYNDANGLMEGNDIFQVVWLPEQRREKILAELQILAGQRRWQRPSPTIVFEGNIPADLTGNQRLRQLLESRADRPGRERVAWLGEALAIKDPTAAVFRRQSGSNLLIIGQNAEAARAMAASAMLSLLAQQPAEERDDVSLITLLDGSPSDDPLAAWLGNFAQNFPDDVAFANLRDRIEPWNRLVAELERRKAEPNAPCSPRFVIIHGLHRYRDLRRPDDDFGFGRKGDERVASPAEQFAELIREGPALGIHVIAWVDTLANVQRAIDRRDLREFEQRVLFQMGVTDSSTLIDSPAASRLGMNRALFAAEELSTPEKFRPYSLPADDYLAEAAEQWRKRNRGAALDAAAVN